MTEEFSEERFEGQRIAGRFTGGIEEPHLKDYLRVILMHRWVVIGVALVVLFVTVLTVFIMTPTYKATATLLIEPALIKVTNFQDVYDPTNPQFGGSEIARREFMETQFKLITSRPLMEKVFAKFNFGHMEKFRDAKEPIPAFSKLFRVAPLRNTRLVDVSFEWKDPKLAAEVVNFLNEAYIQEYRERRLGVTGGGLAALKKKAEDLRPMVASKAQALQEFMGLHGTVSLEESQNIVVERLKDLNKQLTEVQTKRIDLESRFHSIESALQRKTPLEDMPEVMDSQTMRDLKMEWIKTQQEISDLSKRFGPNHPELLGYKAKLDAIKDKVEREVKSILSATHHEYLRAQRQEAELVTTLSKQQEEVMNLDKLRAQYQILRDAYETLNTTYRAIIKRIDEVEIASAAGSEEDNIFVISEAPVPVKRFKPQRLKLIFLATILGPVLGVGLAFFLQYLDTTIKTREEVERLIGLPVFGYVPAMHDQVDGQGQGHYTKMHDLMAAENPRSAVAEAFRSIRTSLSFSIGANSIKSILVTSPSPLEGKSLVSVNIAMALAKAGKRVLLVDADLRKPRLHRTFGISPSFGLSNLLASDEDQPLDAAIQATSLENLFFMPSGPRPPNPAELLGSERMQKLVKEMESKFERVILDTPPVVNVTDAAVLSNFVGGSLIVIRSFSTQREIAQRAAELLRRTSSHVLGAILNSADTPRGAYGYDGYSYYSGYYYYYGDSEDGHRRKAKWYERLRTRERDKTGDEDRA